MNRILYVLSPQRESKEALDWSIEQSKSDSLEIFFLYIVDEELTKDIENCLSEKGFVGEKTGHELGKALNDEYLKRGEEKIKELISVVKENGIKTNGEVVKGNYFNICNQYVKKNDLLLIINKKRSFIGKLILKSESEELKLMIQNEIKFFEGR